MQLAVLDRVLETYAGMDGAKLKEVFLHARSGLDEEEFAGFKDACPDDVDLVGIRVRKDRFGPRLFRHDDHPKAGERGKHPVLRGTFWKRTNRHGLLFTSGFKPRKLTMDGKSQLPWKSRFSTATRISSKSLATFLA